MIPSVSHSSLPGIELRLADDQGIKRKIPPSAVDSKVSSATAFIRRSLSENPSPPKSVDQFALRSSLEDFNKRMRSISKVVRMGIEEEAGKKYFVIAFPDGINERRPLDKAEMNECRVLKELLESTSPICSMYMDEEEIAGLKILLGMKPGIRTEQRWYLLKISIHLGADDLEEQIADYYSSHQKLKDTEQTIESEKLEKLLNRWPDCKPLEELYRKIKMSVDPLLVHYQRYSALREYNIEAAEIFFFLICKISKENPSNQILQNTRDQILCEEAANIGFMPNANSWFEFLEKAELGPMKSYFPLFEPAISSVDVVRFVQGIGTLNSAGVLPFSLYMHEYRRPELLERERVVGQLYKFTREVKPLRRKEETGAPWYTYPRIDLALRKKVLPT